MNEIEKRIFQAECDLLGMRIEQAEEKMRNLQALLLNISEPSVPNKPTPPPPTPTPNGRGR